MVSMPRERHTPKSTVHIPKTVVGLNESYHEMLFCLIGLQPHYTDARSTEHVGMQVLYSRVQQQTMDTSG